MEKYNTKYECSYLKPGIFDESNDLTEKQIEMMEDLKDELYRIDLLNIFNVTDDRTDEMSEILDKIYEKIKHHEGLKECMLGMAAKFISEDAQMGLVALYSFDFMYFTHPCIVEFLETAQISDDKIQLLKDKVFEK